MENLRENILNAAILYTADDEICIILMWTLKSWDLLVPLISALNVLKQKDQNDKTNA